MLKCYIINDYNEFNVTLDIIIAGIYHKVYWFHIMI